MKKKNTITLILTLRQMNYLLNNLPSGYSIRAKAEDLDYIIKAAEKEKNK